MHITIVNRADSENLHISKIQNGGRPPYWKSKNGDISATVRPIEMKFCTNIQIAILEIKKSLYLRQRSTDRDENLQEHANCHAKARRK